MDPLVVDFEVNAPVEHAFATWTQQIRRWWPTDHTITRDPGAEIVFEPRVGGRILERGPDGVEHQWGEVTAWDPPSTVSYLWHIFFDRSEATEVTVSFTPDVSRTRVRIEQTGFERLGETGIVRKERTHMAWAVVTAAYRELV